MALRVITASDITPLSGADVTPIWDTQCLLGEGPHWDREANRLVFLDIKGGGIFVLPLSGDEDRRRWSVADMLSSVAQTTSGDLIGTTRHGLVAVDIPDDDNEVVTLSDLYRCGAGADSNRFNDGKAGPYGNYWAGVMDDAETGANLGAVHRISNGNAIATVMDNMLVPNGPAFSSDGSTAWFVDSARATLYRVQLDGSGIACAPEAVLAFDKGLGYPDGMTCDAQGQLWMAFWDGHCVRRLSPDLSRIEQIDLPVPRPTSLTITPDRIYVTSARIGLDASDLEAAPLSGALFAIEGLDVKPGPDYRVNL